MSFPCNSCGVFAAPGKHLGSNAQAGNAVRILPVPRLKCFIAPNRMEPTQVAANRLQGR